MLNSETVVHLHTCTTKYLTLVKVGVVYTNVSMRCTEVAVVTACKCTVGSR